MTKARQYFYGGIPRTSLQTSINATDEVGLNIVIASSEASSWPTVGPFVVRLERGTPREEAIRCSGRSGTNLVVTDRGYDNTTAVAHSAGSAVFIEHTLDAAWLDLIDEILATATSKGDLLVSNGTTYVRLPVGSNGRMLLADSAEASGLKWGIDPTSDLVVAAGDLVYGSATDTLSRLGIGTTAYPLTVVGGLPAWAQLSGAGIANDAIDSQHYVDGSIDTAHLGDDQVTGAKVADATLTSAHVLNGLSRVLDYEAGNTTVTNTSSPASLGALTIPAGDAVAGCMYELTMAGTMLNATGSNQTFAFALFHNSNQVAAYIPDVPHAASPNLRQWQWKTKLMVMNPSTQCDFLNECWVSPTFVSGTDETLVPYSSLSASSFIAHAGSGQSTDMTGSHTLELKITWATATTNLVINQNWATLVRFAPA